jgi:putative spermidine/putrescine transport system substrate-binding protein
MSSDENGDAKGALPALPAKKKGISRRAVLKAGAAVTGAAIGADAIRGFPTIWAQEIKDIELRHVGVSYSVVKAIGDQAAKDLGFKVTMQPSTRRLRSTASSASPNRSTSPTSRDGRPSSPPSAA